MCEHLSAGPFYLARDGIVSPKNGIALDAVKLGHLPSHQPDWSETSPKSVGVGMTQGNTAGLELFYCRLTQPWFKQTAFIFRVSVVKIHKKFSLFFRLTIKSNQKNTVVLLT